MDVEKISDEIKGVKPGKDFSVFLICLLIALVFWLLNAFTKNYSTVIEVPIEYINIPQDKILSSTLPQHTTAEVSGTGFRLLSVSFFNRPDPIVIDFNKGNRKSYFKRQVSTYGPDFLRSRIMKEIPSDLSLRSLSVDSLKMVVEEAGKKRVPTASRLQFELEYPFFLNGNVSIEPQTVELLGAPSALAKIDTLYTQEIELGKLTRRILKDVELDLPAEVKSNIKLATVELPIDEYTEKSFEIDIKVKNLNGAESIILFPPKANISVLVGLKDYELVLPEDFKLEVDANEITKAKTTLQVKLVKSPSAAIIQDYSPRRVEFILKR